MASTVIMAFNEFLSEIVNLDLDVSKQARSSRDWLVSQIHAIPNKNSEFPPLYPERDMFYGSFARRTKIRELDDLDMIICLKALGTTYSEIGKTVYLNVPEGVLLRGLCHEDSDLLNSRKVINRFVNALKGIPQYEKSELGRNGSAAVLNLKSYMWSFDIVPGFFTTPEADGRTFYIIPDGNGHWMKTDPRVDQEKVTSVNQKHSGNVLNVIRTIKYWNRRSTMPSMRPYLVECILLKYYDSKSTVASQFVDLELVDVFNHIASAVRESIYDPKNIQGDINNLSLNDRRLISSRATSDATKASNARNAERQENHKESIRLWRQIFGSQFPEYSESE